MQKVHPLLFPVESAILSDHFCIPLVCFFLAFSEGTFWDNAMVGVGIYPHGKSRPFLYIFKE